MRRIVADKELAAELAKSFGSRHAECLDDFRDRPTCCVFEKCLVVDSLTTRLCVLLCVSVALLSSGVLGQTPCVVASQSDCCESTTATSCCGTNECCCGGEEQPQAVGCDCYGQPVPVVPHESQSEQRHHIVSLVAGVAGNTSIAAHEPDRSESTPRLCHVAHPQGVCVRLCVWQT